MSPFLGHSLLTIMRVSSPLFSLTTGQKTCNETLGLESGKIENEALSASSSYDEHSTGPHNARYVHYLNLLGWPTFVACGWKKGFRIMQSYSIHSCANKTLQHSLSYKEGGLISTSVCSLDDSKQKGAEQEKKSIRNNDNIQPYSPTWHFEVLSLLLLLSH